MAFTEASKEHIMYFFNAFCKVAIRYAAINAWRDRNMRQREISFENLAEEKFCPLSTSDGFLKSPYEQYPVTICGQTVILTNGELPPPCYPCRIKRGKSFTFTFSGITHSRKSRIYMGIAKVRRGIISTVRYRCCRKKWRNFHMGNTNLVPYGTDCPGN